MIHIVEVAGPDEKSGICNDVLRALPSWFGIESSIVDYVADTRPMPFFAVYDDGRAIGFAAIKRHNPYTAEVYVMGILEAYHRQGLGRKLIALCLQYCTDNKIEFLTVKTLDASGNSESYDKTRSFYLSAGFRPLEVFPLHWDESNPCLFMAMHVPSPS